MRKLIAFIIRKKLKLKNKQKFYFKSQKDLQARYFFNDEVLMKERYGKLTLSHISWNYLVNGASDEIVRVYE